MAAMTPTSMPTPSPTKDNEYIRDNEITYDNDALTSSATSSYDYYMFEIDTPYTVSNPNDSYMEITITVSDIDDYDENYHPDFDLLYADELQWEDYDINMVHHKDLIVKTVLVHLLNVV